MNGPLVIAHRTCPPYAPENSLQGFRVAIEQGAGAVEIDLRSSIDLHPFLMHDNTMKRTTGWPLPIELTPSFLVRRQRLIGGNEPPPRLDEVIDLLPDDRLLAVDVKTPWSILALISQVKRRRLQSRTLVWCSSALVARYALSRLPGAEIAHYKDFEDGPSNLAFIAKAARYRLHAVSLDWRGVTPETVSAAHAAGLKVYSWHKEYEVTPEKLATGIDGVITDHPGRIRTLLAEAEEQGPKIKGQG